MAAKERRELKEGLAALRKSEIANCKSKIANAMTQHEMVADKLDRLLLRELGWP